MSADWQDGDDIDREKARENTRKLLEKPEHKRPKGHPDDEATRDDPVPEEEDE